jgi:8-oxo-dGTP diphosphatase
MTKKVHRLYLVRHAKAGERATWTGDDGARPLSKKGWAQAAVVAEQLARLGIAELRSSPYVRCRQTLEPLAARLGLPVVDDDRLAEGQPFEPVLELLLTASPGTVLCSHGDLIPETVAALVRRGMQLATPPDWRKATVWVLDRRDGAIERGEVWPPPPE